MSDVGAMWDRRFAEHPWPSDPDPLLVELADGLPTGRGLDLGSGPGRNSLWLAAKGWEMTLLDASVVALDQARARAERAGVHVEVVHGDVLQWRPQGPTHDLVIVANLHPGSDVLAQVLASAADALVVGGHLFVVGHDVSALGHHGPPDPDRLFTVERLYRALPPTVTVELLDRRPRRPDHAAAAADRSGDPTGTGTGGATANTDEPAARDDGDDVAVVAWATRRPS
jgi:SAM-dependent methyltransferase